MADNAISSARLDENAKAVVKRVERKLASASDLSHAKMREKVSQALSEGSKKAGTFKSQYARQRA